eukprot:TRINITY_DN1741_c0_g1_i1.p1 TRINITY_DN1741_c0_g1~~TRINITY_DN1741_c0_g1_i1.p1  ORF type:complete len:377 (+),score=114.98 TRINITY_DN1741_c0_g1_i1:196-1326(+)
MLRPKSANQRYDELIHAWKDEVDSASLDGDVPELSRSQSEVMWAASSCGLDRVPIARPKTSNPGYKALTEKAEGLRRERSFHGHPAEATPLSASLNTSEVLWAESGTPGAVSIARPGTSNPKRDSLFSKGDPTQASEVASGVLWSSTASVSPSLLARPHTRKPQLECVDDGPEWGYGVGSPNAGLGMSQSEVLWSSDGGVEVELLARPRALNSQLSALADRTTPRHASQSSPSYVSEVLWSSEDAMTEQRKAGGSALDIESVDAYSLQSGSTHPDNRSPPNSRYQLRPFAPRPRPPAPSDKFNPFDGKLRKTFDSLSPDAETDTITKADFCAYYSGLEHFGAPVNALQACAKFKSAGSSHLTFYEFSCIMLKFQSR